MARELGIWDVDRLLKSMSGELFQEWMMFESINPFLDRKMENYFAQLTALIANMNRDREKHPEPAKLEDFLLKFEPDELKPKTQTADQQASLAIAIARAFNRGK